MMPELLYDESEWWFIQPNKWCSYLKLALVDAWRQVWCHWSLLILVCKWNLPVNNGLHLVCRHTNKLYDFRLNLVYIRATFVELFRHHCLISLKWCSGILPSFCHVCKENNTGFEWFEGIWYEVNFSFWMNYCSHRYNCSLLWNIFHITAE